MRHWNPAAHYTDDSTAYIFHGPDDGVYVLKIKPETPLLEAGTPEQQAAYIARYFMFGVCVLPRLDT